MRVKIEANGQPIGTKVYADDGTDISGSVSEVVWRHRAGEIPTAEVTLVLVALTGYGEARMLSPGGKEVRSITYMDGTEDRFDGVVPAVTLGVEHVQWVKRTQKEMLGTQCYGCRGIGRDVKGAVCGLCHGYGTHRR